MGEVVATRTESEALGPDVAGLTLQGLKVGIRWGTNVACPECDTRAEERADLLAMMHSTGRGQQVLGEMMLVYREYVGRLAETCTHVGAVAMTPESHVAPLEPALMLASV